MHDGVFYTTDVDIHGHPRVANLFGTESVFIGVVQKS